jgi:hypothetical protein
MNYRKQLADNIFNSIPFYWWIQNKGAKELVDGGESIVVPLLYAVNSTVAAYSGYELINTTPQEGITSAKYNLNFRLCKICSDKGNVCEDNPSQAEEVS